MRISDWSSDVCSSDLAERREFVADRVRQSGDGKLARRIRSETAESQETVHRRGIDDVPASLRAQIVRKGGDAEIDARDVDRHHACEGFRRDLRQRLARPRNAGAVARSEEQPSELQTIMRSSYAGFCLKKKKKHAIQ